MNLYIYYQIYSVCFIHYLIICFQGSQFDTEQIGMFFSREIYLSRSQLSLDPYISLCQGEDSLCAFLCQISHFQQCLPSSSHVCAIMLVNIISIGYDITRCQFYYCAETPQSRQLLKKKTFNLTLVYSFRVQCIIKKWLGVWQHTDYQKRNVNTKPVTYPLIYNDIFPESHNRAMVAQRLWE